MSEFMGMIKGEYEAKNCGFAPGGASLHPRMSAHGPDCDSYNKAIKNILKPEKTGVDSMAFMFESSLPLCVSKNAFESDLLQQDYIKNWQSFI
jgi:homogentisate 1,2-dioxygenase